MLAISMILNGFRLPQSTPRRSASPQVKIYIRSHLPDDELMLLVTALPKIEFVL